MKGDLTPVREFKRRAEHALPGRVAKVVLYGSRARGEARRGSDWDIAVFLKGRVAASDATVLSHIGSDLFFDCGWNIHPVTLPPGGKPKTATFCETFAGTELLFEAGGPAEIDQGTAPGSRRPRLR